MRKLLGGTTAALLALTIAATPAFAANAGAKPGTDTIVQIVLAVDGEFDVLQAAVIEAGLAGALSSTDDQYTVFAPTDWAFVSTFRSLLSDNSLTEADVIAFIEAGGVDTAFGPGALADILLFHVTNGRRTSNSVVKAPGYMHAERRPPVPLAAARCRHRRGRYLRLERRHPRHQLGPAAVATSAPRGRASPLSGTALPVGGDRPSALPPGRTEWTRSSPRQPRSPA